MSTNQAQVHFLNRGIILIIVIGVIAPLIFWFLNANPARLFSTTYNSLTTLAQIAGLLGLSLYSLNIILSGRYHFIDRLFHGLDRAYRVHRYTGITAFSLMLGHVALISLRAANISWFQLQYTWFNASDSALVFGRLAFIGFTTVIFITLFAKRIKYERLKKLHQTLGLFLFLGGVHAYLIPSSTTTNPLLQTYILTLVAIGIISYLIRTAFKKWLVPRREYLVKQVNRLTPDVTEVVLKPQNNQPLAFLPGQFNFYRFLQPAFPDEDHPFSITAGSQENRLRFSAKALGDFTSRLPELKPGTKALIQGPYGGFTYLGGSQSQIWIAGGIGITPFISMARTLFNSPPPDQFNITLIYSVQTEPEAVYRQELTKLSNEQPGFNFKLWITSQQGFLTVRDVINFTDISNHDIFICGPPNMISALTNQFIAAGIPRSRLKTEKFTLL